MHDGQSHVRRHQFTLKAAFLVVVVLSLALGWITDRRRLQLRSSNLLQHETKQRALAESKLNQLATWVASNSSLENVPRELRKTIGESTPSSLDPADGFRLFAVPHAAMTLAYVGLDGQSFRVRGGPCRYKLLGEDLSGSEARVIYELIGPTNQNPPRNADGVLTYARPRTLFQPYRVGATSRKPADTEFLVSCSQGSDGLIRIPAADVWPDWIHTAPDIKRLEGFEVLSRENVIRPSEPVFLFSEELVSSDGRRARVTFSITCEPHSQSVVVEESESLTSSSVTKSG